MLDQASALKAAFSYFDPEQLNIAPEGQRPVSVRPNYTQTIPR